MQKTTPPPADTAAPPATSIQPANRAQRRALQRLASKPISRYAAKQARRVDPVATFQALRMSKPYEPGEMVADYVETRAAFERLRTGHGSRNDFDRVSMMSNIGLIRAEEIDQQLVQIMQAGQEALLRVKDRYERLGKFGFDGPGQLATAEMLDAYEAIVDASTPHQMVYAIKEAYRRIANGDTLEIPK